MAHKAESGDQSADEYRAYYEIGYRTNVERIKIDGNIVSFFEGEKPLEARYVSDGYEILSYKKGNRGVRFIFKKTEGTPPRRSSATTRSRRRPPTTITSTGVMIAPRCSTK